MHGWRDTLRGYFDRLWALLIRHSPYIKLGISLLFLYALFTKFVQLSSFAIVKEISFEIILLCLSFTLFSIIIRSLRWTLILSRMDYQIKFLAALRLYLIGIYYGSISPGKMGEFIRGYRLSKGRISLRDGLASVLYDRFYDIVTPLCLTGIYFVSRLFDLPLVVWGVIAFLLIIPLWGFSIRLFQKFKARFHYLREIKDIQTDVSFTHQAIQALLSVANWACYGLIGYFLLIGFGIYIEFEYVLFSVCVVTLMTLIPITISGWGVREGGYLLLFSPFSKPETSIIFSIIFVFTSTYFIALLGLISELATKYDLSTKYDKSP